MAKRIIQMAIFLIITLLLANIGCSNNIEDERTKNLFKEGIRLFNAGEYNNALKVFQSSYELAPEQNYGAADMVSAIYQATEDYKNALLWIDKTLAIKPDFAIAYLRKGQILEKSQKGREAADVYKQGLQIDPKNLLLYSNLAKLYTEEKDFSAAIDVYQRGIELTAPYNSRLRLELSKLYGAMGESQLAEEQRELAENDPFYDQLNKKK